MNEVELKAKNGFVMLCLFILIELAALPALVCSIYFTGEDLIPPYIGFPCIAVLVLIIITVSTCFFGIKILKPQEALVLTLFGKYTGTLKKSGMYFVNPFSIAVNPAAETVLRQSGDVNKKVYAQNAGVNFALNKKISLKQMTLNNNQQKINDRLGNPIEIGIAVIWRVVDTAKAVFAVDNYKEFLSLQCDVALRNIVKIYPYDIAENVDTTGDGTPDEGSLRGSSEIVANRIKNEIQSKVNEAGIEIIEARKMIVDGAVGMVEMALDKLNESGKVILDEERKAAMVSNLLVVLCGNKDAQPVVNSGSLY